MESRTVNSLKNFSITFVAGILLPIIGLVKYSLFIGFYGSEINGVQITMESVIAILNIFEVCFSLAFRQLLFEPLANNNKEEVNRIYSCGIKIFRATGYIFLTIGFIIALLFPLVNENPFSNIDVIIYFVILMLPYGISYFLMGPNLVIIADQKEYKISIWIQSISIIRMFLMIGIILLKLPVIYIFIIESLQILVANVISRIIALKYYPWLNFNSKEEVDIKLLKNIKYTFIQRLEIISTTNIDTFVISLIMNYTSTSIYGAYNYIVDNINKIVNKALEATLNSFGHLFSTDGDSYDIFLEFFEFVSFIASLISICVCIFFNDFMSIWLKDAGEIFKASLLIVIVLSFNIFYMILRESYIIGRDAKGLFKYAQKNAILFSVAKLALTLIFVKLFGISGAIISTMIVNIAVDFPFNPKLLCDKVFIGKTKEFYLKVLSKTIVCVLAGCGLYGLKELLFGDYVNSIIKFILAGGVIGVCCVLILFIIYYLFFPSFRNFVNRIKNTLLRKIQRS